MFLGKWRIERLGIGNAWLLLNAAYGHDIGMVIQHQEILDLWRDDKDFQKYLDHIDFISVMQEAVEDDDEETEKEGMDEEINNFDKKEYKENVRERAERYLREMLETNKPNRNYIITDDVLVNLLEEFISKGRNKRISIAGSIRIMR